MSSQDNHKQKPQQKLQPSTLQQQQPQSQPASLQEPQQQLQPSTLQQQQPQSQPASLQEPQQQPQPSTLQHQPLKSQPASLHQLQQQLQPNSQHQPQQQHSSIYKETQPDFHHQYHQPQQTPPPQQDQLLNTLVAQISALKDSVEQLRVDTSVNKVETQLLREAVDRQNGSNGAGMELNYRTTETPVLQSTESSLTGPSHHVYKKMYDLPTFTGRPDDWPLFLANFEETTNNFQYSPMENTIRLQKCLQGEAREAVSALLIHPNNVGQVIKTLAFRFGRPDLLVKAQLTKFQQFPVIHDARVEQLIPFASLVENIVAFLLSAKCEQHLSNPTLLDELVTKLPMTKRFDWAKYALGIQPYPTIRNFSVWLTELAKVVQLIPQNNAIVAAKGQLSSTRRLLHTTEGKKLESGKGKCGSCESNHHVSECEIFKQLLVEERWNVVKTKHLCFSCLKPGHGTSSCRYKRRCEVHGCRRFHHKLLHDSVNDSSPPLPQRLHNCRALGQSKYLFRILPVILSGPRGEKQIFAMFDEGSSITLLEEKIAVDLGLQGKRQTLTLQWFGGKVVNEPSRTIHDIVEIRGLQKESTCFPIKNIRTVRNLGLPIQSFSKDGIEHLNDVPVANYDDAKPALLIGLDNCHLGAPIRAAVVKGPSRIVATDTKLGWVAYGPQRSNAQFQPVVLHLKQREVLRNLDELVESYFSIENFGVSKSDRVLEADDDIRAKRILREQTRRMGKCFETGLLWRTDEVILPNDHFQMARKRLTTLENKMKNNRDFADKYKMEIGKYITKGYAKELSDEELARHDPKIWYLPHFGVINPHKPNKVRVVFDAAAEVGGISLNSMLLKGPEQAKPLLSILFKFRQGIVGVTADIEEMFSQVRIRSQDVSAQRFLWREGFQDQPVRTYAMSSMIFGAACSPCTAEYIKNLNAKTFQNEFPEAVNAIVNNHYVDDYVCSFSNEGDAERISLEVRRIHAEGGFNIRNFVCNVKAIQDKLNSPSCNVDSTVCLEGDKIDEKVLGMYWNTEDDTFRFRLKFNRIKKDVLELLKPPTKREMLGIVVAVFDPYGFLADFLVYSKILLQETWKCGIGWDEQLPESLYCRWKLWWAELKNIRHFRLSRCYSPNLFNADAIELHIFTDASESAFSAVGYFRILFQDQVEVGFVSGKTRCAPQKLLSIPRLELQAAVLGTRLQATIKAVHDVTISRVVYWSDSKTIISWIRSSKRRFKPFVAHRVAEILDSSEVEEWRWLPTDLNVADDATRAISPPKFAKDSRWLGGPGFLRLSESQWPQCLTDPVAETAEEELRPRIFHIYQPGYTLINIVNFSSFNRLRRVIAWVMRCLTWLCRARSKITTTSNKINTSHSSYNNSRTVLTVDEILTAEKFLYRQAQQEEFYQEISGLEKDHPVSKSSPIFNLSPFLDKERLLRLSGRTNAAAFLSADAKNPLILPQKHPLTRLIVSHYHHRLHHQNDSLIINEVRQRYWIPRIRSVLKNVKGTCWKCKYARAKPATPLMGQLPEDRLTPFIRPFTYTGVDYFGPLQVTVGRKREKRWVALFTCLTIRAIHLELASTDAFILCLRNFINRRGTPIRIRSDNGTNFVGAKKELANESKLFDTDRIQNEMTDRGIEWKFICPLNPSEGGAWERMVQSVKKVLLVTMREEAPRVETLRSLLIEAENIVNSRPLTELPLTSEEDEPLTPNHLLIGCPNSTQTPNLEDRPICCRKQWRIAQQLKNRFWKRWIAEYLPMLTKRSKWHEAVPPLEVGNLIIICDSSQPRSKWQRGKVTRVYPGKDGQVRSADIKTSQGTFRRPASKLATLKIVRESP